MNEMGWDWETGQGLSYPPGDAGLEGTVGEQKAQ